MDVATRERLRALIRRIEQREPRPRPAGPAQPRPPRLEEVLPDAERRETAEGTIVYREVPYPLHGYTGRQRLDGLRLAGEDVLRLLAPREELEGVAVEDLLFLDIETTGLGGAGAMTFLVATGTVEGGVFVLRQYLALSPADEAALLDALLEDMRAVADGDPVLVTYNGRGFDAPMLDARATMHRRRAGFDSLRHVDLLPPARTLYRGLFDSCRLACIEAEVLGLERAEGEVSGVDVPGWYFRYLRTRDPRWLDPLVRHNEVDVVALGGLLAWIAELATGANAPANGIDALALGRLFADRGDTERARGYLQQAAALLPPGYPLAEALERLALLHKRSGRRDLAEPLWLRLTEAGGPSRLRAHVELAIYYEHHRRDFTRAEDVVVAALEVVETSAARSHDPRLDRWRSELDQRFRRLRSKTLAGRA